MSILRIIHVVGIAGALLHTAAAEARKPPTRAATSTSNARVQASTDNLQYIDPATLKVNNLESLKWSENPNNGVLTSYLLGDPAKEGLYVALVKWPPHKMSHPHFHPNDRYVTVLSGVWWVGTGRKFAPDHTVPLKAGTVVTHFGKHVHYDGAKDEGCTLEIIGIGPATITNAEDK